MSLSSTRCRDLLSLSLSLSLSSFLSRSGMVVLSVSSTPASPRVLTPFFLHSQVNILSLTLYLDEDSFAFQNMHEFSTVDGFVEITEELADMIKFVVNEPSVGLFYVQQHTHNAVPNLINVKNNVVDKSQETALHTEDLEDSITMVGSMKECGFPIADEMIRDIKKSLSIISTKQPKRGLLRNPSSSFLGRTSSWSPYSWSRDSGHSQSDLEQSSGYLSNVFKLAKQRAGNFKWSQVEFKEEIQSSGENLPFDVSPESPDTGGPQSSTLPDTEGEDLPLSKQTDNELQEESQLPESFSNRQLLSLYENYDEFKADKEAKFEEWLGGMDN